MVSGSGCAERASGRTICFRVGDMMPGDHGWMGAGWSVGMPMAGNVAEYGQPGANVGYLWPLGRLRYGGCEQCGVCLSVKGL